MGQSGIPSRYRVIEEVGQGGMAIVYRAQDETLKRQVAIKLLHAHLSTEPESKARLEREAQAVAKLRHDNILEVFDYSGPTSESSYIVTEFIDGQTLKQFMTGRSITHPEVAALIAAEVCGALTHAHAAGVIHRDVKPENVMIRKDGLVKLMDFGIAQVVDLQRLTITGQLLGSPAYMAPELIDGKQLDFRTDVFSVGIMLCQLATGVLPFGGKNPHEVLKKITDGKFADPRTLNRLISDGLHRIILHALARNPDERYPDVGKLLDDLSEYLAAGGLGDVRRELRAYFGDPEEYERALPARLTKVLAEGGRRRLTGGKTAQALELWNRALAVDAKNPEVLAGLRTLGGRRRARTAALALAAIALASVAGFGVAEVVSREAARPTSAAGRPQPPAALAPAALPPPPSTAAPERPRAEAPGSPPRSAEPRSKAPLRAAASRSGAPPLSRPEPHMVAFTLAPIPKKADVYLDGIKRFAYDQDHQTIEVPWEGVHQVEFRNECCFPRSFTVGPGQPRPPGDTLVGKLEALPAILVLGTDPPVEEAQIMVVHRGRRRTARIGEETQFSFEPDEYQQEVEVHVILGDRTTSEKVTVRAGEKRPYAVKLKVGAKP